MKAHEFLGKHLQSYFTEVFARQMTSTILYIAKSTAGRVESNLDQLL